MTRLIRGTLVDGTGLRVLGVGIGRVLEGIPELVAFYTGEQG